MNLIVMVLGLGLCLKLRSVACRGTGRVGILVVLVHWNCVSPGVVAEDSAHLLLSEE